MEIKGYKVAPLCDTDDMDGLSRQRCPEDLFRARRGFEQCKLNFLTTMVDNLDGQTAGSGLFYKRIGDQAKATKTDRNLVVKKRLEMDRNCHVTKNNQENVASI
ncbi:uncharacterized protein LOC110446191 [Mizuhopecten yessoensis]|uniref:uncharacterized protein LOC110446191 n=1 Tax=Mizuhopecten yessoensis TaxID=6573 RepID=UPI000B45B6E9|nr:uncharacterized protein LOC110446191 [Mizuhopecten yessoensis]